jgi:pilus assembly protein Flp/PilA
MSKVLAYLNSENGASAAEYALILAIVGAAIAAAAIFLGNTIASAMNSAASCISAQGNSSAC